MAPPGAADPVITRAMIMSLCFHVLVLLALAHLLRHSFDAEGPEGVSVGTTLTAVTRATAPSAASAASAPSSPARSAPQPPTRATPPVPSRLPSSPPTPRTDPGRMVSHPRGAPVAVSPPKWKAPSRIHAGPEVIDVPTRPASATVTTIPSASRGGAPGSGGVAHEGTEGAPASPAPYGAQSGSGAPMRPDLALYSSEMGMRLRQFHNLYFLWKRPDDWTIARYRVDRQGRVHDARILDTTTPGEISQRVLLVLDQAAPFPPLPEGIESLDVVELFWSTPRSPWIPGTRAEALSRLPDGREITWQGTDGRITGP